MREILFRGKRLDNGEWVEGVYFPENDTSPATIFNGKGHCVGDYVDHKTVGQYTGLTDKNGKKIFEGDIIENWCGMFFEIKFGQHTDDWNGGSGSGWFASSKNGDASLGDDWFGHEVIGNIHDNPELLEEEE